MRWSTVPGWAELVEAGVWSPGDAVALARSGLAGQMVRVLVEMIDLPAAAALSRAAAVLARLDELAVPGARLLHGEGAAAWPLVTEAGRRNLATRIGLEDTLLGPDGRPASGNAALVREAARRTG
ncbi:3-keto-5-aminohexanoate cleavage protein [Spongiactinospora sp. 9N601]|uniref:3-keto-5-aminohexanoate cleavage protein n=1 Tax=Spongiactinospora sp. 9N601 TaxID=3375149 RepID=UPI0037A92237